MEDPRSEPSVLQMVERNEVRESRARLARHDEDAERLREFSALLIDEERGDPYEQILDAAMALLRADFASLQKLESGRGELYLLASRNLHPDSVEFWRRVSVEDATTCGSALQHSEQVVVPDVRADESLRLSESQHHWALNGIVAVQSTPLITREGKVLGMISTHWRRVHTPDEHELRLFDVLARQAADILDRRHTQNAIRINASRMRAQAEAFKAAINGAPLDVSLGILARGITEEIVDARTAVYVADANGNRLRPIRGAGNMPASYLDRVDGVVIGPETVACGLTTATGLPVVTRDVLQEPLLEPWLQLARDYDYRGCWSFPIETTDGRSIGTLAMYFQEPRDATASDRAVADAVTHAAAIIISRHTEAYERARAEGALLKAQRRARAQVERLVSERTTERDELRRQLASVEEAERRRLSRELHDQLGQDLTAFHLGLEDAARLLATQVPHGRRANDAQLFARIDQLKELATRMVRGARYVSLELRPPELDDVGIASALDTYLREWSGRYDVAAELSVTKPDSLDSLPDDVASALYRIAQEALTNVAKHAQAAHVSVTLDRSEGDVRLVVEDDGRGFDAESSARRARRERRYGIAGMRERAALAGGQVEIESGPDSGGATVYVRIPLQPKRAAGPGERSAP